MARIPEDTINRIRDTADIVDVVSQYVDLRKRGQNFVGLCPFHNDVHPSLYVSPSKQIYKCFACGAGGHAISFLMDFEKISFVDSIKRLGDRYGIEIKADTEPGAKEFFSNLYAIHELAMKRYQDHLFSKKGEKILSYLKDRGLTEETIKRFNLGLALDTWDDLLKAAKEKGFAQDVLDKSGLFTNTEKGTFDRFHNRIMFPIFHPSGKVIAFGGRAIDPKEPAKYVNSPETPLYHKSKVLYGFHASGPTIRKSDSLILVEGYTDFLQLFQAGARNTVAVSGTALTEKHVNQIRRFAKRVYLAYDGDPAGIKAALRAGYLLYQAGVEPRVIKIPENLDPDDWVQKQGLGPFKEAARAAIPLIEFQLQTVNVDEFTGIEASRFVQDIIQDLAPIQDGIIRGKLLRTLAEKLKVDEEDLYERLEREIRRGSRRFMDKDQPRRVESEQMYDSLSSQTQKAQMELVKIMASANVTTRQQVRDSVELELFSEPILYRLAEILMPLYEEIDHVAVVDQFEDKNERELVTKIFMDELFETDLEIAISDYVKVLRLTPVKEQIKELRLEIRELERQGEDPTEKVLDLTRLQKELNGMK